MIEFNKIQPKLLAVGIPRDLEGYDLNRLKPFVSESRRIRSEKFRFKVDKARCLTGELLLSYGLIKSGLQIDRPLRFEYNDHGKPSIVGIENLDFSISHSGKWVIVGISNYAVGVDVERIHDVSEGIAKRFFSSRECALLKPCVDRSDYLDMFFRIWVLKEAYIKAIGRGLSCPLGSFSVNPFDIQGPAMKAHDSALPQMFLREYPLDGDHKCAYCSQKRNFPEELMIEELPDVLSLLGSKISE